MPATRAGLAGSAAHPRLSGTGHSYAAAPAATADTPPRRRVGRRGIKRGSPATSPGSAALGRASRTTGGTCRRFAKPVAPPGRTAGEPAEPRSGSRALPIAFAVGGARPQLRSTNGPTTAARRQRSSPAGRNPHGVRRCGVQAPDRRARSRGRHPVRGGSLTRPSVASPRCRAHAKECPAAPFDGAMFGSSGYFPSDRHMLTQSVGTLMPINIRQLD